MSVSEYDPGWKVGKALCEALGITLRGVQRLVIDCEAAGLCKVYVQTVPTREEAAAAVRELRDGGHKIKVEEVASCGVDADGFVYVVPRKSESPA